MKLFSKQKAAPPRVQLRSAQAHPFSLIDSYVPLGSAETRLYRMIREAVPVVDAAIMKIVRLTGGFEVSCADKNAQRALAEFIRTVPVGRGQTGLESFLAQYLDSMITCGRAVGEIVANGNRDIAAVLCGNVADVQIREGKTPLDFELCGVSDTGCVTPFRYQNLLLFTPFNPEADSPYGVSMLRSMPFLCGILLKIYQSLGINWERAGNVRFAVVYKPQGDALDRFSAQERAQQIAAQWSEAMQSGKSGSVRDFVAVGDVDIKVIGADNQILDSEVPVRQILEQLIARTGIPPFLLGLNWSTTERMSAQQADLMTSELNAIRRTVTPVIEKICRMWLNMHGYATTLTVEWETINLQDEVEEAKAALYLAQRDKIYWEEGKSNEDLKDGSASGSVCAEQELQAINAFAKTQLTADEVYAFQVLLCDNEVDRDFERFSVSTLRELSELFVGATGICDHDWRSENQVARIYRTELVTEKGKTTSCGEAYVYLKGFAYMLRTEANAELIAQIEGGIKRETSVGCSVAQSICSICGAEIGTCSHEKGKVYGGERCCAVLTGAVDAYEWSFVAVPAQRSAGVIKSFIESEAGRGYAAEFAALEKSAQLGRKYLDSLRAEVLRLCLVCDEKMHPALEKSVQLMEEPELIKLKDAFEEASAKLYPPVTQLPGRGEVTAFSGEEYII